MATPISSKSRKTATPTPSKGKEEERGASKKEAVKKDIAVKKGPAIKKPAPKKPKPKWVGWVQLSAKDEENYKKKVNAEFTMEDGVQGKRTRTSRVAAEDIETGSSRLRARSISGDKKVVVKTDSDDEEEIDEDDIVDLEKEEEEEEAFGNEDASSSEDALMYNEASLDGSASNEVESVEEDSMEIDEESQHDDGGSVNYLSDPPFDNNEDDPDASSAELGENSSAAGQSPGNVESGSDESDSPRSPAASSSSDAELPPSSDSPLEETAAQQGQASPASPPSEDSMEVDAEDEGHEGQVPVTVHPAVESDNYAALYQHKGNYWGEHPESAIRSTLPRLGWVFPKSGWSL